MLSASHTAARRCPGLDVAFDVVVVSVVVFGSGFAGDESSVERSGTGDSSPAPRNLSTIIAPPPMPVLYTSSGVP